MNFIPKRPINHIRALVQIPAWHWLGDKPSSEPIMISLFTHISVTQSFKPVAVKQIMLFPSKVLTVKMEVFVEISCLFEHFLAYDRQLPQCFIDFKNNLMDVFIIRYMSRRGK